VRAAPALLLLLAACTAPTRSNVVLVTIDGVRWQEIFGGADAGLIENKKETGNIPATKQAFWRETADERRRALAPFLWGTVAVKGQLVGNVDVGSQVLVANRHRFSYPGYHELLSGFPSETIDSNRPEANPDVTVLEWLHGRPGFGGSVAAYCSWDVFPSILNRARSGLPVEIEAAPSLRRLAEDLPAPWRDSVYDAFVFHGAMEYLREKKPRVLYLAFGDTDEWAHAGWYNHYLESIRRSDAWLRELWWTLQSMPEYAGNTTLIVTCDHGRGDSPAEWRSHNMKVNGAGYIWVAAMGPGVAPLGERTEHEPLLQGQVAATVAAAVGEDFSGGNPRAEPQLPSVFIPAPQK